MDAAGKERIIWIVTGVPDSDRAAGKALRVRTGDKADVPGGARFARDLNFSFPAPSLQLPTLDFIKP